jgi:putative flippase GtrA
MYDTIKKIITLIKDKLFTREIITYGISGVLTTAINLITYYLCWNLFGIHNLIANIIAWVIAVTFAYFMNAVWVFKDERQGATQETIKMFKFYIARVFSLIVEEAGLLLFVEVLHFSNMMVKCGLAVIVIILNYVLSKVFIFNKKSK